MPKVQAAATSGADSHQGWCPSSTARCSASASSIPPSGQTKTTSAGRPVWSAVGGGAAGGSACEVSVGGAEVVDVVIVGVGDGARVWVSAARSAPPPQAARTVAARRASIAGPNLITRSFRIGCLPSRTCPLPVQTPGRAYRMTRSRKVSSVVDLTAPHQASALVGHSWLPARPRPRGVPTDGVGCASSISLRSTRNPNDGRWGRHASRSECGTARGAVGMRTGRWGCTQPETPDAGEAAEDSAPPAPPTATSTEDAEPTQMPAAAHPADESSSLPAPAASAAPSCGTDWGSLVKAAPADNPEMAGKYSLYNVTAGRHACFDRQVLNFTGPMVGYSVGYVDLVFCSPPDGDVAGGARRSQARDHRRGLHVKVRTRKPARGRPSQWLAHLPSGGRSRLVGGKERARHRHSGPTALPGLCAGRSGRRIKSCGRRRAPLVTASLGRMKRRVGAAGTVARHWRRVRRDSGLLGTLV